MYKMEELISTLLKLKLDLHRSDQYIHELVDLINVLSLKIDSEERIPETEKIEFEADFLSSYSEAFFYDHSLPEQLFDGSIGRTELTFVAFDSAQEGLRKLIESLSSYTNIKVTIERLPAKK